MPMMTAKEEDLNLPVSKHRIWKKKKKLVLVYQESGGERLKSPSTVINKASTT